MCKLLENKHLKIRKKSNVNFLISIPLPQNSKYSGWLVGDYSCKTLWDNMLRGFPAFVFLVGLHLFIMRGRYRCKWWPLSV